MYSVKTCFFQKVAGVTCLSLWKISMNSQGQTSNSGKLMLGLRIPHSFASCSREDQGKWTTRGRVHLGASTTIIRKLSSPRVVQFVLKDLVEGCLSSRIFVLVKDCTGHGRETRDFIFLACIPPSEGILSEPDLRCRKGGYPFRSFAPVASIISNTKRKVCVGVGGSHSIFHDSSACTDGKIRMLPSIDPNPCVSLDPKSQPQPLI